MGDNEETFVERDGATVARTRRKARFKRPRAVRHATRVRRLDWTTLSDRQLLNLRLCDLGLKIEGTAPTVEKHVAAPHVPIDRDGEILAAGGKITAAERKAEGLAD